VLASVMRVQGSAYRGPGARMLICSDGTCAGFLSGGCLEADVREKAAPVLESGQPVLVRYDMTSPDDILWGLGMGCDGIVEVLLERLPAGQNRHDRHDRQHASGARLQAPEDPLLFLDRCLRDRHHASVVTVYGATSAIPLASRFLLSESGETRSDIADASGREQLLQSASQCLQQAKTFHQTISVGEEELQVLAEHVSPPTELLVCGAGYDAVPLVHFASELGWTVTLTDHRPSLANSANFPDAGRIVALHAEEASHQIDLHSRMVAVVMTHNFPKDVEWLSWLLPSTVSYIGMLGPRARLDKLLEELASQGEDLDSFDLDRLFGPVGLDIGASTPEEIALAILSEIRAVLSGSSAGFLKQRSGPIHNRSRESVELAQK
ncbi:MAG: XdhC family protein, partial [Acidobacteriota bacterium]